MANPKCAACNKTVYVVERLDCLNKPWHKGCFKCTTCSCSLTLKSYRGMGGLPYCQTHYPMPTSEGDAISGLKSGQQSYAIKDPYAQAGGGGGGGGDSGGGYDDEPAAPPPVRVMGGGGGGAAPPRAVPQPRQPSPEPEPEPDYEEPAPAAPAPAASGGNYVGTCVAAFDYTADAEDELSFAEGDVINIIEYVDDNWWSGELNGRTGLFPSSYVEGQQ